jgi:hypothetical protein
LRTGTVRFRACLVALQNPCELTTIRREAPLERSLTHSLGPRRDSGRTIGGGGCRRSDRHYHRVSLLDRTGQDGGGIRSVQPTRRILCRSRRCWSGYLFRCALGLPQVNFGFPCERYSCRCRRSGFDRWPYIRCQARGSVHVWRVFCPQNRGRIHRRRGDATNVQPADRVFIHFVCARYLTQCRLLGISYLT